MQQLNTSAASVPPRPAGRTGPAAAPPRGRRWGGEKNWDEHVGDLEEMAASPGFLALRERILSAARLGAQERVLDIGAGTGLLTLEAARHAAHVSALDVSPAMCGHLARKLAAAGLANTEVVIASATELPFPDGSFDVVLSNYCFHHVSDSEKLLCVAEMMRVLRPGGRLVFGDMMFRLAVASPRDREVISLLVRRILRRGPAGVVRLLRNGARIAAGRWEHPADVEWWSSALRAGGFASVDVRALEHEGGIAIALKPPAGPAGPA